MPFDYTVTPSAGNRFTYCCGISFHPGSNTLKLNRAAFADISEPPAKLLLVFGFQDPVEVQCQLLCYFQLWLFSLISPMKREA